MRRNLVVTILGLSILTGTSGFAAFPQGGAVWFTQEQAEKIDPDLMVRIRQLSPDSTILVWLDISSDWPVTSSMLEELEALGARVRIVTQLGPSTYSISAEIVIADLPNFASLPYIILIDLVTTAAPGEDPTIGPDT